MRGFFKQSDANEIKDFPALVGCLIAINMIFQLHLAPAIFAYKNALKKECEGEQ